ncbi:MAG: radical SAM protein [Candidatus Omnitrophica bacterium]|nr:radical SAM protein [Candidatus Omnitrophota bacterium]
MIKEYIYKINNFIAVLLMYAGLKIPKQTYSYKIARFILHKIMGKGRLFHVMLDVAERSDKRCKDYHPKRGNSTPSLSDLMKMFSQMRGRILRLDLMGGEPLLRDDIYEIIKAAKKVGRIRHVTMFTHGSLIDEKAALRLKEMGLNAVYVSFYSVDPSMQNGISSVSGTFAGKTKAIKELVRIGIPTYTFTILNKNNASDVDNINKYVRDLGARPVFFNQIPMDESALSNQLSSKEVYEVKTLLNRISSQHMVRVYDMFEFLGRSCFGGYFMLSVKVDGTVTCCPFILDIVLGNAFEKDIFKIFETRFTVPEFRAIYQSPAECIACTFEQCCQGGCKAGNKTVLSSYHKKSFYCLGPWQNIENNKKADCIPYWF